MYKCIFQIWVHLYNVFFVFFVTLTVFPAMQASVRPTQGGLGLPGTVLLYVHIVHDLHFCTISQIIVHGVQLCTSLYNLYVSLRVVHLCTIYTSLYVLYNLNIYVCTFCTSLYSLYIFIRFVRICTVYTSCTSLYTFVHLIIVCFRLPVHSDLYVPGVQLLRHGGQLHGQSHSIR